VKDSHKYLLMILAVTFVFLTIVPGVSANLLDNVLAPFKGIDIAQTYIKYYPVIDAILYFILFIGIAGMALGERFKDNKSVPTVIGIMLAISMLIFEYRTGFNLGKLAPLALLILLIVLGSAIYKYTKNLGLNTLTAIILSLVLVIILINIMAPAVNEWIDEITWLSALKNIILLAGFAALIIMAGRYIKGIGTGENAFRRAERDTDDAERRERNIIEKEDKHAKRLLNLESEASKFEENIEKLEQAEAQLNGKEKL
jgi:hypothetical protein